MRAGNGDFYAYIGHGDTGVPGRIAAWGNVKGEPKGDTINLSQWGPQADVNSYNMERLAFDMKKDGNLPQVAAIMCCKVDADDAKVISDIGVPLVLYTGGDADLPANNAAFMVLLKNLGEGAVIGDAVKIANEQIELSNRNAFGGGNKSAPISAVYGAGLDENSNWEAIKSAKAVSYEEK